MGHVINGFKITSCEETACFCTMGIQDCFFGGEFFDERQTDSRHWSIIRDLLNSPIDNPWFWFWRHVSVFTGLADATIRDDQRAFGAGN